MKNLLFLSLVFAFLFISCSDDDDSVVLPPTISTTAELTAALTEIYENSDAPGFAISVLKNDAILYQKGFGDANIAANKAYTNQTIQPIGSVSKTFVAAAIVKAIEQGHFTLDTDINDILPVEIVNPLQPDATITVKHLVTHTSGLLDNYEIYLQAYHIQTGEDLSTEGAQLLQQVIGAQQRERIPLADFLAEYYLTDGDAYTTDNFTSATPGTLWSYSNVATALSAFLIEAATGNSFHEYVRINIFQPLGMNNTGYSFDELNTNNLATLYWDKDTPLPRYGNDFYPEGDVHTSSEDLSKFLLDMMKGAKGTNATLFSEASYAMLFDPLLPNGMLPQGLADNQGIFWFLDGNTIKHDGSDPGTTCMMEFDKTGEAGYFLLTNMDAVTDAHEQSWAELLTQVNEVISKFVQAN